MERERLGSRLGFILIAAGCAIGLGNIWKFPYMVGQYGGGAFVLIYLVFLVILGVPLLSVELSLGRASQRSPVNMCRVLEPEGTRWHLHGYLSLAGVYLLMIAVELGQIFMLVPGDGGDADHGSQLFFRDFQFIHG